MNKGLIEAGVSCEDIREENDSIPSENGAYPALFFIMSGFEYQRSGINSSALS